MSYDYASIICIYQCYQSSITVVVACAQKSGIPIVTLCKRGLAFTCYESYDKCQQISCLVVVHGALSRASNPCLSMVGNRNMHTSSYYPLLMHMQACQLLHATAITGVPARSGKTTIISDRVETGWGVSTYPAKGIDQRLQQPGAGLGGDSAACFTIPNKVRTST